MSQLRLKSDELAKLKRPSKYRAIREEMDGFKFDSRAEAEMYRLLKLNPETRHIDIHPKLSLPGGITLSVDFIVWKKDGSLEAVEVKGFSTRDFKIKRKLFDQFHPLAPLKVMQKTRGGWRELV